MRFTRLAFVSAVALGIPALAAAAGPTATDAYKQYREALAKAMTIQDVLPYLAKSRQAEIEKTPVGIRAGMFESLKALSEVLELTVTKETPTRAGATLQVKAITGAGEDATATVQMEKENGIFKLGKESWSFQSPVGPARTCDQLAADVKSPSVVTRARAANALQESAFRFGEPCLAAVPALVDLLADPVSGIRSNASNALAIALPGAARQGPEAIGKFKSQLPRLASAKEGARKAAEEAMELYLQNAVVAFGPAALPILVKDLSHPSRELRWGAAKALETMGPAALKALPALKDAARTEKDSLVKTALDDAQKALQQK